MNLISGTDSNLTDTKSHSQELSFWQTKDLIALSGVQKSQENVMVEIKINLRSKRPTHYIWAPEYIRAIAPAFELLYEGKGTGTLLPLYKLFKNFSRF